MEREEIISAMQAMAPYNEFLRDVLKQHSSGKQLTERQWDTAEMVIRRITARRQGMRPVDISPVEQCFAFAVISGIEKPSVFASEMRFSLAPPLGRNRGWIYVAAYQSNFGGGSKYIGKVKDGMMMVEANVGAPFFSRLHSIMENFEAAIRDSALARHLCPFCSGTVSYKPSRMVHAKCAEAYGISV